MYYDRRRLAVLNQQHVEGPDTLTLALLIASLVLDQKVSIYQVIGEGISLLGVAIAMSMFERLKAGIRRQLSDV